MNRGVSDIPGFLYRDDSESLYGALFAYSKDFLSSFYKEGLVQADTELNNFLSVLSNPADDSIAFIKGFPGLSLVTELGDVASILAQVLWVCGVQYHALNSFKRHNFDVVYPTHPGKILAALPATKGSLTDDEVQLKYIAGENINQFDSFYLSQAGGFSFFPLLQKPDRLTNFHNSNTDSAQTANAAVTLRQKLLAISKEIRERESANDKAPKYLLLDPKMLPHDLYV